MPQRLRDLETRLATELVPAQSPGACVATFDRDGVRWLRALGTRDLHTREPVRPDTLFRWFSVTKVITATAVLQLAERGAFSLDAPLARPLHWFRPRGDASAAETTVRSVLSHDAGIANPIPAAWAHPPEVADRAGEAFCRAVFARHATLRRGRARRYTNLGYLLMEALVERASGQPFRDYLADRVFTPLGMRDARVGHDAALRPRLATGHERTLSLRALGLGLAIPRSHALVERVMGPWVALRPFGLDGAGYGGVVGSMDDLVRFARAHLRLGELDGARVLREDSAREMMRAQSAGFGLAWWRGRDARGEFVAHGGEGGGYRAALRLYPNDGIGFAVLANAGGADLERVVGWMSEAGWE